MVQSIRYKELMLNIRNMKSQYKTRAILIFFTMTFLACDEELIPPAFDTTTSKEKLLLRDWSYDYILMGTDTILAMTNKGEPQTVGVRDAINLRYMRYEEDHSYQSRWEDFVDAPFEDQPEYGVGDNYQPNFGYWHLSENGETLIHNKLQTYEKRYEIVELTDKSFRRKLVGVRESFLTNGEGDVLDTITGPWIEVFVPRTITN